MKPLATDPRVLDLGSLQRAERLQYGRGLVETRACVFHGGGRGCPRSGAQQPITLGTMIGTNIELYAPLCDVICGHAYTHTPAELKAQIEGFQAIGKKTGKVMLVNECMPGCLDDLRRAELVKFYTRMLSEAGFGWMGWALREGKAVSTRRDRYDDNGLERRGISSLSSPARANSAADWSSCKSRQNCCRLGNGRWKRRTEAKKRMPDRRFNQFIELDASTTTAAKCRDSRKQHRH